MRTESGIVPIRGCESTPRLDLLNKLNTGYPVDGVIESGDCLIVLQSGTLRAFGKKSEYLRPKQLCDRAVEIVGGILSVSGDKASIRNFDREIVDFAENNPGQLLVHYSPEFLVSMDLSQKHVRAVSGVYEMEWTSETELMPMCAAASMSVLLSDGANLIQLQLIGEKVFVKRNFGVKHLLGNKVLQPDGSIWEFTGDLVKI